jgi:acetolactate synthase I/II/III large subunit
MTGAALIAKALKDVGIKRVYIFPGGTIAPLLDELIKCGISYYCGINEQGAGYAAIGAAKITGEPQVVLVTSGPGATNLITPVADAYYDSIPIIAITGQVGTTDINQNKHIRQTGFQETDHTGLFSKITKSSKTLQKNMNIYAEIVASFLLSSIGRKGPVHIDMPMDIQRENLENQEMIEVSRIRDAFEIKNVPETPTEETINKILGALGNAKRLLILAGNGVFLSDAVKEFRNFVHKHSIPVVLSLPGKGILGSDDPLCFSYVGHTGEFYANLAAYYCDVLLVLGARLDVRQTGSEVKALEKDKTIIRVDIDSNELNYGRIKQSTNLNMDIKDFLNWISGKIECKISKTWINTIQKWKTAFDSKQFYQQFKLSSLDIISSINDKVKNKKAIVTTGVGTHQHLAARFFNFSYPEKVLYTSCGHGTMGYDIPTMIGAILNAPSYDLGIVFVGDGSFQMNIQELAKISELRLPIKIFVLDNGRLGLVSQFQLLNWKDDPTTGNKINPSFSRIAEAYGIKGRELFTKNELARTIDSVFENSDPEVIHCHIDKEEDVLPMLLGGQKMNEMHPFKEVAWKDE